MLVCFVVLVVRVVLFWLVWNDLLCFGARIVLFWVVDWSVSFFLVWWYLAFRFGGYDTWRFFVFGGIHVSFFFLLRGIELCVAFQWHTDDNGIKREFHGRNKAQDELKHDTHHRDLEV